MSKVKYVCRSEAQKRDLGSRRAGLPQWFLTQKWSGTFSAERTSQETSGPCIPSSLRSSDFSRSHGGQFRTSSASPSADSVPPQAHSMLSLPFFNATAVSSACMQVPPGNVKSYCPRGHPPLSGVRSQRISVPSPSWVGALCTLQRPWRSQPLADSCSLSH